MFEKTEIYDGTKEIVFCIVIKIYINNFIVYNKMPYLYYKYTKLLLCTLNLRSTKQEENRYERGEKPPLVSLSLLFNNRSIIGLNYRVE